MPWFVVDEMRGPETKWVQGVGAVEEQVEAETDTDEQGAAMLPGPEKGCQEPALKQGFPAWAGSMTR